MGYKIHRFEVDMEKEEAKLEAFLNGLTGEVVSILPIFKRNSLGQIYGVASRTAGVFIVEKT